MNNFMPERTICRQVGAVGIFQDCRNCRGFVAVFCIHLIFAEMSCIVYKANQRRKETEWSES